MRFLMDHCSGDECGFDGDDFWDTVEPMAKSLSGNRRKIGDIKDLKKLQDDYCNLYYFTPTDLSL